MIRKVELQDAHALADIYNHYIAHSTATFDIRPIGSEEMRERLATLSTCHPYFVCEEDWQFAGSLYAHP